MAGRLADRCPCGESFGDANNLGRQILDQKDVIEWQSRNVPTEGKLSWLPNMDDEIKIYVTVSEDLMMGYEHCVVRVSSVFDSDNHVRYLCVHAPEAGMEIHQPLGTSLEELHEESRGT